MFLDKLLRRLRGRTIEGPELAPFLVATLHPSAALRAPDSEGRKAMLGEIVADLRRAASLVD